MANHASDFDFLVATVKRSISQLETRIAPASRGLERGAGLREHMSEALSAIESRVAASERRFSSAQTDIERESVIDSLRLLNRSATSMHEATDWLGAAHGSEIHIGVLYFIDEAAAAIVGVETDVIAVGDAGYQYATVSWPFALILARLKRPPSTKTRPIIVFYPPQETQTVLLHSLFAHELAHAAVDEHQLLESVLGKYRRTRAFKKDFREVTGWLAKNITTSRAQIVLNEHLTSWTTEYLCDAIAIEYLGPTYVLAFAGAVLATSWSEPSQTHPPTSLRIAAMLEQLRQRGWNPLLETSIPKTFAWLQSVGASPTTPFSRLEQFLTEWTHRFTVDIDAAATSRLGSAAFSPLKFREVSQEMSELLDLEILPAQRKGGGPMDRRAILLAGWLQVFELDEDSPSSIAKGNLNEKFQDFLGAAMEMSVILETWKQV